MKGDRDARLVHPEYRKSIDALFQHLQSPREVDWSECPLAQLVTPSRRRKTHRQKVPKRLVYLRTGNARQKRLHGKARGNSEAARDDTTG